MSFRYVIIRVPTTDSFKKQTLLGTVANYEGNIHFKEIVRLYILIYNVITLPNVT